MQIGMTATLQIMFNGSAKMAARASGSAFNKGGRTGTFLPAVTPKIRFSISLGSVSDRVLDGTDGVRSLRPGVM